MKLPTMTQFSALGQSISRAIVGTLLPPVCMNCQGPVAISDAICPDCWQDISFISPPLCDRLGIPLPYDTGARMVSAAAIAANPSFRKARAVAKYDGTMRQLVHALKFNDRQELRALMGRWLASAGAELLDDADVIIPVPLTRLRLLTRRFNQAALLARELANLHPDIKFEPHALIRSRQTKPQVGLTRNQRKTNVNGAFKVPPRRTTAIAEKSVLVIDDVITTGATANACARTLLKAGARQVDVLALAIVADQPQMTT